MYGLTPVVKNIIIICVGIFLLQKIFDGLEYQLALYTVNTSYFRPYQLFTYMLAHGDFLHILFNMMMFAFVGSRLELVWGFKRFLQYFLITGIGAALIYLGYQYFFNPYDYGLMVGASGAIYGMLLAFGILYPEQEFRLLFPPIAIKAKYAVFVFGLMTFMFDRSGKVAHVAHFGGALVGFLVLRFGLLRD